MTNPTPRDSRHHPIRSLLQMLWMQPIWAIPFAIFFGTMYGGSWLNFRLAYELSLVFSFCVGLGLWFARYVALRDLYDCPTPDGEANVWRRGLTYLLCSVVSSYVAAVIIHFTLMPGFLGSLRAVLISGMFTLLFSGLFGGISFAIGFYRQSIARARQVEGIRAELAEAELRALRAQIHPHFLFNTLNTIAALIHEDPPAAEETTTRLAEVFRYALRASEHEQARLADELEFVRGYLAIEHTRFGERLRVRETIEPGLENVTIPSLLLQPVVENAVRYAVAPRSEGGTIEIAVRRDPNATAAAPTLLVEIRDDGPGMDAEAPSGHGFGLRSVRERLQLAGPPHALHIETAPGRGTLVRLTFPHSVAASAPRA